MTDLDLAADRVDDIVAQLDLSEQASNRARELAEKSDMEWPVNRSPKTVAAGSVYLAALLVNEKRTQKQVAVAADCNKTSIMRAYREIADHAGITDQCHSLSEKRKRELNERYSDDEADEDADENTDDDTDGGAAPPLVQVARRVPARSILTAAVVLFTSACSVIVIRSLDLVSAIERPQPAINSAANDIATPGLFLVLILMGLLAQAVAGRWASA